MINKVFLEGYMTYDPVLRKTNEKVAVTNVTLAIPSPGKKKENEAENNTYFVDVTFWNKQAESIAEYGRKGRLISVEGNIKTRKRKINDENISFNVIDVLSFSFLDANKKSSDEKAKEEASNDPDVFSEYSE
ncbi:MAG: single-stranded DNA-binding protein [Aerococcus sp.]|nr:single-stranded DNA-binding protein [Aerococcus sp.]